MAVSADVNASDCLASIHLSTLAVVARAPDRSFALHILDSGGLKPRGLGHDTVHFPHCRYAERKEADLGTSSARLSLGRSASRAPQTPPAPVFLLGAEWKCVESLAFWTRRLAARGPLHRRLPPLPSSLGEQSGYAASPSPFGLSGLAAWGLWTVQGSRIFVRPDLSFKGKPHARQQLVLRTCVPSASPNHILRAARMREGGERRRMTSAFRGIPARDKAFRVCSFLPTRAQALGSLSRRRAPFWLCRRANSKQAWLCVERTAGRLAFSIIVSGWKGRSDYSQPAESKATRRAVWTGDG